MENCGKLSGTTGPVDGGVFRACSACAGDYEDPDHTVRMTEEEADDEDEEAERVVAEDFPPGSSMRRK